MAELSVSQQIRIEAARLLGSDRSIEDILALAYAIQTGKAKRDENEVESEPKNGLFAG